MKAAAEHLTPVTLELGGKSPTIVCADADIDVAARRIVWGKLLNAGQTCIAPDYVLAERPVRDQLVDAMVRQLDSFYGRDRQASPDLARIIDARHHGRLMGLLGSSGGTIVVGGEADLTERYVAPTIVVDPDLDSDLMQQEIFGPILPVLAVDSVEDAIAFVNDRPKPLALYVFSRSKQIADRILARTSSGGACVKQDLNLRSKTSWHYSVWQPDRSLFAGGRRTIGARRSNHDRRRNRCRRIQPMSEPAAPLPTPAIEATSSAGAATLSRALVQSHCPESHDDGRPLRRSDRHAIWTGGPVRGRRGRHYRGRCDRWTGRTACPPAERHVTFWRGVRQLVGFRLFRRRAWPRAL